MNYRRVSAANPSVHIVSAGVLVMVVTVGLFAADVKKEFKYTARPGSNVTVSNAFGGVDVRTATGRQVTITAIIHSDKVEVNSAQLGNRIRAATNFLQQVDSKEGQVDYIVMVPPDCNVVVQNGSGILRLSGVRNDVSLKADEGQVELSDINNSHIHVQTLDAPVTLTNVRSQHVEVLSNGGKVQLTKVTGPEVTVKTDSGDITYDGDFSGGGDYSLINHTGNINVNLPATASVDLNARSMQGSVQNDFPFQPQTSASALPRGVNSNTYVTGTSQGTSGTNFSSVELSSFSGTIRVKKR
ncbi:MAG TPA: DUF4097 family beta strand repeat-containing protein [Terriglobales bacterium]|jgi:DUF4097 and DUF4098 domain-containing protein YvlB|nr:DUF4097 family beta strand repeat-containing protein [Terriglobales bacterium]